MYLTQPIGVYPLRNVLSSHAMSYDLEVVLTIVIGYYSSKLMVRITYVTHCYYYFLLLYHYGTTTPLTYEQPSDQLYYVYPGPQNVNQLVIGPVNHYLELGEPPLVGQGIRSK